MADINLQAIHDEMVLVAYEAGRTILSANPADIGTGTKLNCASLSLSLSLSLPPSLFPNTTYTHTSRTFEPILRGIQLTMLFSHIIYN